MVNKSCETCRSYLEIDGIYRCSIMVIDQTDNHAICPCQDCLVKTMCDESCKILSQVLSDITYETKLNELFQEV